MSAAIKTHRTYHYAVSLMLQGRTRTSTHVRTACIDSRFSTHRRDYDDDSSRDIPHHNTNFITFCDTTSSQEFVLPAHAQTRRSDTEGQFSSIMSLLAQVRTSTINLSLHELTSSGTAVVGPRALVLLAMTAILDIISNLAQGE